MKIKTSKTLDDLFEKLTEYDYKYIDELLINDADCYTIDGNGNGNLIEEGFKLCITAQSLDKSIYKIVNNDAEAFFVGDYKDVAAVLHQKIKKAEQEAEKNKALEQSVLTESERNKLLFLFDTIKVAPEKSQKFIKMIKIKNTSTAFKKIINTLITSTDIKNTIASLRNSLC